MLFLLFINDLPDVVRDGTLLSLCALSMTVFSYKKPAYQMLITHGVKSLISTSIPPNVRSLQFPNRNLACCLITI